MCAQASLEGQEGVSLARVVTTLELGPPPRTTTHMQASTVRRGLLTGRSSMDSRFREQMITVLWSETMDSGQ